MAIKRDETGRNILIMINYRSLKAGMGLEIEVKVEAEDYGE
jgi:hypothetical protein